MSAVLGILFLAQERYKTRRKRIQYATLIDNELVRIQTYVNPTVWRKSSRKADGMIGTLPKNTYDGLVASGMLSVFDSRLQLRLHEFYEDVDQKRYDRVRGQVTLLREEIHRFRALNKRHQWW